MDEKNEFFYSKFMLQYYTCGCISQIAPVKIKQTA